MAICCNRRGGGVNRTPSHVTFSRFSQHTFQCRTYWLKCFARTSSMYHLHGVVVLVLFDSPLCTLHRLSHLPFHSLNLHLHLLCGSVRRCFFPASIISSTYTDKNNPFSRCTKRQLQNPCQFHILFEYKPNTHGRGTHVGFSHINFFV